MMHQMQLRAALLAVLCLPLLLSAAEPAQQISNGSIQAKIYLPDSKNGFYKGGRFDWSGVIGNLTYKGHNFYLPWFTDRRPGVRDFVYEGDTIVAGTASAITGPVEEYGVLGYDEAPAGGVFVKLGVGALRKPDTTPYDHYKDYGFADEGKWTVTHGPTWITFRHDLTASNGIAYAYTKTVRLVEGQPKLILEHSLRNNGKAAIKTTGYNHNFLTLDGKAPGAGYTVSTHFDIKSNGPLEGGLAKITGRQLTYQKTLQGQDRVSTPLQGFGPTAADYDFRLENKATGTGVRVTGDQPLARATLWSIRSVVAVEPFIDINIEPGKEMTWNFTYEFYTLGK